MRTQKSRSNSCASACYQAGNTLMRRSCRCRCLPIFHMLCVKADNILRQISKITGGISNALVKVTPATSTKLQPVAVKVFGQKTELFVDREREIETLLKLNDAGFGAQVLATFGNGRIEEFLYAKTLTPEEMSQPRFAARIARRLRQLHAVDVGSPREPQLWGLIESWLDTASKLHFNDPAKQERFSKIDWMAMRNEVADLRAVCSLTQSPMVFMHADLLSGNIIIIQKPMPSSSCTAPATPAPAEHSSGTAAADDDEAVAGPVVTNLSNILSEAWTVGMCEDADDLGPMQFIDFEYSGYGYRGFDLGNHFNEYAGFDCDYSKYPDHDTQKIFLLNYLAAGPAAEIAVAADTAGSGALASVAIGTLASNGQGGCGQQAAVCVDDQQLCQLMAEADVWALASHAYWGIWAVIQARYSPIDFDYLDYSQMRWNEYYRRRNEFMQNARNVFGKAS